MSTQKKIEGKIYISKSIDSDYITLFTDDMSAYGYVVLGVHDVTLDIPQVDVTAKQIEALEAKKQTIRAEAQVKINQIDERIQSLLAIEHKAA